MGSVELQKEQVLSSNDIELAEDVRKRWNEDNPDFGERLQQYDFTLFLCRKQPRINPKGENIYLCTRIARLDWKYDDWCDLDGIYLVRPEVVAHEKQCPFLTYPIATDNNTNEIIEDYETSNTTFLTSECLCKRWNISPAQLVKFIQSNEHLPVYWRIVNVPF